MRRRAALVPAVRPARPEGRGRGRIAARRRPGSRRSCSQSTRRCSAAASATTAPASRSSICSGSTGSASPRLTPRSAFDSISSAVTWADVERFASLSRLPVVLKGIVTAEDARLACEHGAAGIVVSNHGGRQLDGVSATIDVLPEVVEAVDGRIEVLVDGGIRRGSDVVKALALGARAVLVGRPPLWGLAVGRRAGRRGRPRASPRRDSPRAAAHRLPLARRGDAGPRRAALSSNLTQGVRRLP